MTVDAANIVISKYGGGCRSESAKICGKSNCVGGAQPRQKAQCTQSQYGQNLCTAVISCALVAVAVASQ